MYQLDSRSNVYVITSLYALILPNLPPIWPFSAEKVLYPLVAAAGIGALFQVSAQSCHCERQFSG